ncbi:dual specificity protein kinase TTK isoform X1 [Arapaima gigas]
MTALSSTSRCGSIADRPWTERMRDAAAGCADDGADGVDMEEDEHTDRQMQFALLCQKLKNIKTTYLSEDDTSPKHSDNINQILSTNSPEKCLAYLTNLEKRGDPHTDLRLLANLIDCYTRVFSCLPLSKHSQNESYARMLVRYAELKAIQEPDDAEDNFTVARSNSKCFAFVHIAHAQFELSQGNRNKSTLILQRAFAANAKPTELLEIAQQNLNLGKTQLLSQEDKENIGVLTLSVAQASAKGFGEPCKISRTSEDTGDLQLGSLYCPSLDQKSSTQEDPVPVWRSGSHRKKASVMPGRVPLLSLPIPEDSYDDSNERLLKKSDTSCLNSSSVWQTSGSKAEPVFSVSSSKKSSRDGDSYSLVGIKPSVISPEHLPWEDLGAVDSTTTLLHRAKKAPSKTEDTSGSINQILSFNSPETCFAYLASMEKRGDPQTDSRLLTKLIDCYTQVFSSLPLSQHSQNESYARMLVRYAELKAIQKPEDAQDSFILARSSCKSFAFVHIAHAQFELSQGNASKCALILQRASGANARPTELLDRALQNLKLGRMNLLSLEGKIVADTPCQGPSGGFSEVQDNGPYKSHYRELSSDWRIPARTTRNQSAEDKPVAHDSIPASRGADQTPTPSVLPSVRLNPALTCETPTYKAPSTNSYATPVHRNLALRASAQVLHGPGTSQLPCTPLNQVSYSQQPMQGSVAAFSNDSITIKGRQFFILKMIGRGGSSKVYQVLDHRKQLFAVKYVNLEEADTQTVESYKNEIEHLNHLQQYSDQIIKLYDYEITNSCIYMLMECGNLDLNTWLRNRKEVNPLERKFYWKNMLEAVQTIHKHGIVHSDLKPANFVIVNASLKLIDFGIANRIQPDVTSIVKDSQVGTLNYMPPEAIKDPTSKAGKPSSKISPKGDVWSLGCILYCMTYGKTPFQSITNQIAKLHAITDPSHHIEFPDIAEKDLLDVLKRCLVRNPKERISIAELLVHPYLQLQSHTSPEPVLPVNNELHRILNDLAALQSPNSIARAASNLAKMCKSGKRLDVSECLKSSSQVSGNM